MSLAVPAALLVALLIAPAASATQPRSNAERDFLTEMISHHSMAIEMSEMATEKAPHQEVKDVAADIIRSQTAERTRMRGWLKRWYGRTASNELSEHDEEQMRELEAATGPGFEVRFLAMMSVHHTQAVERALAVRASRLHPATRRLTGAIIRTQEREIAQFQKFLVDFYAN